MVQISVGLKKLSKRETLPDGPYTFRIDRVGVTKKGTGEGAYLIVTNAQDKDLVGKRAYKYLVNYETEMSIGLSQILASLQLLEVPSGEHGENDTHNLVGLEFSADVTTKPDDNGNDRNEITPEYDADWLDEVRNCSEEDMEVRVKKERAGTKKKSSKRSAKK